MKSQGFSRSEADHCAYFKRFDDLSFIVLLLYVDGMLVSNPIMKKTIDLKGELDRKF